jgi:hypothetical protein
MTTEEKKAIEIIVKGAIERLLLNIKCQRRRETFEEQSNSTPKEWDGD